jgi:transketolase
VINDQPGKLIGRQSDYEAIHKAIAEARKKKNKPTIIRLRTTIGYGSKQQGSHGVHGSRKRFHIYDITV